MTQSYFTPLVVGAGYGTPPRHAGLRQTLAFTGNNCGNLIFSSAVATLFEGCRRVSFDADLPSEAAVSGADSIVLVAANWLNGRADLGELCDRLEATDLPVFALGLGAQSDLTFTMPVLKPGTKRLIELLAERATLISVRGEFSRSVLNHYGIRNAAVTGCPSFLPLGRPGVQLRRATLSGGLQLSDVALHGTRHHFNDASSPVSRHLYRHAFRSGIDLVLQSELADMYFLPGMADASGVPEKAMAAVETVYDADRWSIGLYLRAHGRAFFHFGSWMDFARSKSFLLGTRIHATIAGLLAGTPSMLIAHDARTVELAEAMGIPFVLESEIDIARPLDLERLRGRAIETMQETDHQSYFDEFDTFFEANELAPRIHPQTLMAAQ
ncbi:Polysaccharide pyruvyl transferase [Roseivivax jejudonensis]|uniref:Polysaccharide pyruvyl transferase n=1 Tax=Roseivivax jejudonensis TaxID=1529041 RepID=A0A1X7A0D6_9RHOB|nr:polysaccharide pyruvyl transferase family protein [Roseivivax jejudonensis]SLN65025.1 Polysaccharide pyruvyl transferase [Roseivivax jejudonensis]